MPLFSLTTALSATRLTKFNSLLFPPQVSYFCVVTYFDWEKQVPIGRIGHIIAEEPQKRVVHSKISAIDYERYPTTLFLVQATIIFIVDLVEWLAAALV